MSRGCGDLAMRLLEQSNPVIGGANLATHDPAIPLEMLAMGALLLGPPTRSFTSFDEDEGYCDHELEWLPDRGAYGYFAAAGYVVPDPASLQTYRLDLGWWLDWLSRELNLVDTGKPFELVKGHAWDIGDLWVTKSRKVPVIFGRRLALPSITAQVIAAMQDRPGRAAGLVLTSSKRLTALVVWPHRFESKTISVMLRSDSERFSLDPDVLVSLLSGVPHALGKGPVYLSPDMSTLTILGEEMIFRGIQQNIVRLLVEAHAANKRFSTQELLSKAGSQAPDLEKAFKGNRYWPTLRRFIRREQRHCWIDL